MPYADHLLFRAAVYLPSRNEKSTKSSWCLRTTMLKGLRDRQFRGVV